MTAGMNRQGHNIVLFLDTPRAEGELNHRFFVASPEDCDERQIVRYAETARANLTGEDYLAISRPVAQVSRGQTRSGLELLVLAGITTGDPSQTARLRERLNAMLHSFQDTSLPVETDSTGLLIPSRRIAELQQQLRVELAPGSARAASAARPARTGVWNAPRLKFGAVLVLLAVAALSIVIVIAQNRKSGGSPPQNGESPKPSDGEKRDWKFLSDDSGWAKLAELTGLPVDWKLADASRWAERLMKTADPDWNAQQQASPDGLRGNIKVLDLLHAVSSTASPERTPDADSVSNKWLSLQGKDAESFSGFWMDLKKRGNPNTAALKKLLHDWERALVSLSKSKESDIPTALRQELMDFAKKASVLPDKVASPIQILVQTDLRRFLEITEIMDGASFAEAAGKSKYGEAWNSRHWHERLDSLKGLSTDGQLPADLRRFFEALNGSVGR